MSIISKYFAKIGSATPTVAPETVHTELERAFAVACANGHARLLPDVVGQPMVRQVKDQVIAAYLIDSGTEDEIKYSYSIDVFRPSPDGEMFAVEAQKTYQADVKDAFRAALASHLDTAVQEISRDRGLGRASIQELGAYAGSVLAGTADIETPAVEPSKTIAID